MQINELLNVAIWQQPQQEQTLGECGGRVHRKGV